MYAIIECGGRQYRAEEGHSFSVEKLPQEVGEQIELDNVLLLSNDGDIVIGQPAVEGATVFATVTDQYRGKKIFVWKYKPKKRYRRRRGHRQYYTRLRIDSIVVGDSDELAAARSKAAERKAADDAAAKARAEEQAAQAAVPTAVAEAQPSDEPMPQAPVQAEPIVETDIPATAAVTDNDDKTLLLDADDSLALSDDELMGFMESASTAEASDKTLIMEPDNDLVPDELEMAALAAEVNAVDTSDFKDEGTVMLDDLTLVEGIGPKIQQALQAVGILTLAELSITSAERLNEIVKDASISAQADTWPEQARIALTGDMDALQAYQDELDGGIAH